MTELIKKTAKVQKGSENPLKVKVGKLTRAQVAEVVKLKMVDMNTKDPESAANCVMGSARSMGIDIVD